jgi:hypothetical protein
MDKIIGYIKSLQVNSKIYQYLGLTIALLSFYYIFIQVKTFKFSDFFLNLDLKSYFIFCLLILINLLALLVSANSWRIILEYISGKKVSFSNTYIIYIKSNIAKYLPGNVLQYVGRNVIGGKLGWTQKELAISTFIEIFLVIVAPFFLLFLFMVLGLFKLPKMITFQLSNTAIWSLIFFLILIFSLFVLMLFSKNKKIVSIKFQLHHFLIKIISIKMLVLFCRFFVFTTIGFAISGLSFYFLSAIVGIIISFKEIIQITCILSIAGYSGILTPGVPGGIGIKESVSVFLLSQYGYSESSMMFIMVLYRIISIVGEILGFGISFLIKPSK